MQISFHMAVVFCVFFFCFFSFCIFFVFSFVSSVPKYFCFFLILILVLFFSLQSLMVLYLFFFYGLLFWSVSSSSWMQNLFFVNSLSCIFVLVSVFSGSFYCFIFVFVTFTGLLYPQLLYLSDSSDILFWCSLFSLIVFMMLFAAIRCSLIGIMLYFTYLDF